MDSINAEAQFLTPPSNEGREENPPLQIHEETISSQEPVDIVAQIVSAANKERKTRIRKPPLNKTDVRTSPRSAKAVDYREPTRYRIPRETKPRTPQKSPTRPAVVRRSPSSPKRRRKRIDSMRSSMRNKSPKRRRKFSGLDDYYNRGKPSNHDVSHDQQNQDVNINTSSNVTLRDIIDVSEPSLTFRPIVFLKSGHTSERPTTTLITKCDPSEGESSDGADDPIEYVVPLSPRTKEANLQASLNGFIFCYTCDEKFSKLSTFYCHEPCFYEREAQRLLDPMIKFYQPNRKNLNDEVVEINVNTGTLKCDFCTGGFKSLEELQSHISVRHLDKWVPRTRPFEEIYRDVLERNDIPF